MIVGFTGTREGMSAAQVETVARLLRELRPTEVHHGCCVGADEQLHAIARVDYAVYGHPGPAGRLSMDLSGGINYRGFRELHVHKDYGPRNQDIVDACDVLVDAPAEMVEAARGGTWQTVRRARRAGKRIIIAWPDGRIS